MSTLFDQVIARAADSGVVSTLSIDRYPSGALFAWAEGEREMCVDAPTVLITGPDIAVAVCHVAGEYRYVAGVDDCTSFEFPRGRFDDAVSAIDEALTWATTVRKLPAGK